MDNTTIPNTSVLRKFFSLLPFESFTCSYLDWGVKKLTTPNLMRISVATQLGKWESYTEIEEQIRLRKDSQELYGLTSISGSQLSRRVNSLPPLYAQRLFLMAVKKLQGVLEPKTNPWLFGKLQLVDSSSLHLGPTLGKWAYVTRHRNQVKLHVRFSISEPGQGYPEQVIPSTGNVDDREVMMDLVTDPTATHVLDRGYVDYGKMDQWIKEQLFFAMRINDKHVTQILESYETDSNKVNFDGKVLLGKNKTQMEKPIRLVEFKDEKDRFYRVVTNRWDLSAEEVAELYKCRWFIELFFKWVKQHLRLVKLQSTKPEGIWNQIFFAMTVYCLAFYIQIEEMTKKSTWRVLNLLRMYSSQPWEALRIELHREPKRTSKGRQKSQQPRSPVKLHDAGVAIVKPVGEKRSKTAKYFK